MARAEFRAPHTFAFAGAFLVTMAILSWVKHGALDSSATADTPIVMVLGSLWALMEAAFFSLGCAWGGVSRPRKTSWALACRLLTAAGFLSYAAFDSSFPPPTGMEEAQQQYTRGTVGVVYTVFAPIVAGFICARISRRGG